MQTGKFYHACDAWAPQDALLTWANGSSDLAMGAQRCTNLAFGEAAYARLDKPFFKPAPSIDPAVKAERKCEVGAVCPELTTCVLAPHRFDTALSAKRGAIARGDPVSFAAPSVMTAFLSSFVPQVLVTVVVLAPSLASEDMVYARTELKKTYLVPTGFSDWVTDVIRIERFSMSAPGTYAPFSTAPFEFEIFAGVEQLFMFGFTFSGVMMPIGPAMPMGNGVFKVVLPPGFSFMDVVGAEDLDECAGSPCDPNADCFGTPGGTPGTAICECRP